MSVTNLDYISLGIAGLALLLAIYSTFSARKTRAFRKFFGENNQPDDLEEIINQIVSKIELLDTDSKASSKMLESVATQLNTATQHVGLIRYNSNGDDGGNLSFSLALLDAHQSGIVLTSLHGRQNNRIYSKVVTTGTSESTLSAEEREALIQAITNTPQGTSKNN